MFFLFSIPPWFNCYPLNKSRCHTPIGSLFWIGSFPLGSPDQGKLKQSTWLLQKDMNNNHFGALMDGRRHHRWSFIFSREKPASSSWCSGCKNCWRRRRRFGAQQDGDAWNYSEWRGEASPSVENQKESIWKWKVQLVLSSSDVLDRRFAPPPEFPGVFLS